MVSILDHAWGDSAYVDRVWAQVAGMPPSRSADRLFMALQAYCDESSSGAVYVVGGHIATAASWAAFSQEWEQMLPNGIIGKKDKYTFKMSEMAKSPERLGRVGWFYRIIEEHALLSVSTVLQISDIKTAKGRIVVEHPKFDINDVNMHGLDDPYIVCFFLLMDHIHRNRKVIESIIPLSEKIDYYFDERSDKFKALQAWSNFLDTLSASEREVYGATPRFEDDHDFLPLQAADLWAWWVREAGERSVAKNHSSATINFRGLFKEEDGKLPKFNSYADQDTLARVYQSFARQVVNPQLRVYDLKYGTWI